MKVKIYYKKNYDEHISQIITGFIILKNLFESLEITCDNDFNYPNAACIYVFIGDQKKIIYDMHDGYSYDLDFSAQEIESIDTYYKRSFNKSLNIEKFPKKLQEKVKKLPFNYHVTCKNNPINNDKFMNFYNIIDKNSSVQCKVSTILKIVKRKIFKSQTGSLFNNEIFNSKIQIINDPKIMFSTRLWDPDNSSGILKKERLQINKERINLVKRLKEEFKDNFIGGIEYSDYAKKKCPELILPFYTTKRQNYIKLMKSSDICIATSGLHQSIGWKLGEYVASSKCIIHTPFFYEIFGDFQENKNYFLFENDNQLISLLWFLINNPKIVYETKVNNSLYFKTYLSPDRIVYNSIKKFL